MSIPDEPDALAQALDNDDVDRAVEEYQRALPGLEAFRIQLVGLLRALLDREERPYHQIESRCKGTSEFREKILRKGYTNPAVQMTDKIGLRAIMFYDSDVDFAVGIFRNQFIVDEANSEDKRSPTSEDRFGYRSYHLVVKLNQARAELPEWERFADIPFEIQVRTVLAHAWAAVDHELGYKSEPGLSNAGKRLLARVSAMLETADELFDELRSVEDEFRAALEAEAEDPNGPEQGRAEK